MITRLVVKNFRKFKQLDLPLNKDLNIIVGDNESGKSTILAAINLALNFKVGQRFAGTEVSSYMFHKFVVDEYINNLRNGQPAHLPEILIEIYLSDVPSLAKLKGTMNSHRQDVPGLKVHVNFDEEFRSEYQQFISDPSKISSLPIEYYKIEWHSFADNAVTNRGVPIQSVVLDAINIRLQQGSDSYIRSVINENLDEKQRVELSLAFRNLREGFFEDPSIQLINKSLRDRRSDLTDKDIEFSLDLSHKHTWDSHLVPYLDKIPLNYAGMGEQNCIKLLLSLGRNAADSSVVLIEELENHLSFTKMAQLLRRIRDKCQGKQLIITTHSAYVSNKLGLNHLVLLGDDGRFLKLASLTKETYEYFQRLPGYDTLRMILAKKAILVEGPSDELIVQRAYMDAHGGNPPIEDGIDVISVRGLSFKRFLEIAKCVGTDTTVVTDNDGDFVEKIQVKYADYSNADTIKIRASEDTTLPTLENQILACNSRETLNRILGKSYDTDDALLEYMKGSSNKAYCALKIFSAEENIEYPVYVRLAVE